MSITTQFQPDTIAQLLHTHITQEIAYDRANFNLTRDFKLIEQGIIDSMGILRVINFIEEQFGIALAPEDLMLDNFATIEAMTAFISSKLVAA